MTLRPASRYLAACAAALAALAAALAQDAPYVAFVGSGRKMIALKKALLEAGTTALAYETLKDTQGRLPLLAPMSAVAGNMAVTIGSYYLARFNHGKGVQLGCVLGERHGNVAVLGDGVVGRHAAKVADSMGSNVVMFTRHSDRKAELKDQITYRLRVAL